MPPFRALLRRVVPPVAALVCDVLDLYAPPACAACDAPHPSHPAPPAHRPALCALCALGLEPPEAPPPLVLAPYAHHGPLARAIHRAKYGDDPAVARRLGALLAHALAALPEPLPAFERVVPVPLHPRRLATRGFNQAAELARALGAPVLYEAIARTRDTPSQVGLGRDARTQNVRAAFAPARRAALEGRAVLLVDDVVTTGATLSEAAAALHTAGARVVARVALSRAPLEHPAP